VSSRTFLAGLRSETEIGRQRQLVSRLLHDFEAYASDWLWETDERGRLRHVSVRLAEALGATPEQLYARRLVDVLPFRSHNDAHCETMETLGRRLAGSEAFRDAVIGVSVASEPRWWALTGRPLVDPDGGVSGWRGVGCDVTEARNHEFELLRLASVDNLTGVANRHQFLARLAGHFPEGRREPAPCVLLLLDIDDFKTVNDSLGHAAGDHLLREAALRLGSVLRDGDLLARLGGDEFAILLPGANSRFHARGIAARIRSALAAPLLCDDIRVEVRVSIGVCSAPENAASAEQLLRRSDLALYSAKAAGRDTVRFFASAMEEGVRDRLDMLGDLRTGLGDEQFCLVYQPIAELASGKVVGYEALVRWRHPSRGVIAPLEFIPLAEESGLIEPLGVWILETACRDALSFRPDTTVSINVSARQSEMSDLAATIAAALRESGLPSHRLVVELTESTLMRDVPHVHETLAKLRDLGVRVALDDFGTGYSSLSYLRSFPLDQLKIDRSFVRELDAEGVADGSTIGKAIVDLADALGLETVAEGIETGAQLERLREIGCTLGQGYALAPPIPRDDAVKLGNALHASWAAWDRFSTPSLR